MKKTVSTMAAAKPLSKAEKKAADRAALEDHTMDVARSSMSLVRDTHERATSMVILSVVLGVIAILSGTNLVMHASAIDDPVIPVLCNFDRWVNTEPRLCSELSAFLELRGFISSATAQSLCWDMSYQCSVDLTPFRNSYGLDNATLVMDHPVLGRGAVSNGELAALGYSGDMGSRVMFYRPCASPSAAIIKGKPAGVHTYTHDGSGHVCQVVSGQNIIHPDVLNEMHAGGQLQLVAVKLFIVVVALFIVRTESVIPKPYRTLNVIFYINLLIIGITLAGAFLLTPKMVQNVFV